VGEEDLNRRESRRVVHEIVTDKQKVARREAENAVRQFDAVAAAIAEAQRAGGQFRLRPSFVLELNRLAVEGVNEYPGSYRPHRMQITGSAHVPPPPGEVAALVEDLCDHVNENADDSPILAAAYVMWRLNWIHPFDDGNGRTARAVAYYVLCARLGFAVPGPDTIPEQIERNKGPYYRALEAADRAWQEGRVDVSEMERLLEGLLARQLAGIHDMATGGKPGTD
jgi:Fic family protein